MRLIFRKVRIIFFCLGTSWILRRFGRLPALRSYPLLDNDLPFWPCQPLARLLMRYCLSGAWTYHNYIAYEHRRFITSHNQIVMKPFLIDKGIYILWKPILWWFHNNLLTALLTRRPVSVVKFFFSACSTWTRGERLKKPCCKHFPAGCSFVVRHFSLFSPWSGSHLIYAVCFRCMYFRNHVTGIRRHLFVI